MVLRYGRLGAITRMEIGDGFCKLLAWEETFMPFFSLLNVRPLALDPTSHSWLCNNDMFMEKQEGSPGFETAAQNFCLKCLFSGSQI